MGELALHILDIVQNSISAEADLIIVSIVINDKYIAIEIADNGCGMSEQEQIDVLSPFCTSRSTRKVGLGIPMLKECCDNCNGEFELTSKIGEGTKIYASFEINHIDRPPLGNIAETMMALITCNVDRDFIFKFRAKGEEYNLSTIEIKQVLAGVPINNLEVASFIEGSINEGINRIYKEDIL